jgi:hypothetical protein
VNHPRIEVGRFGRVLVASDDDIAAAFANVLIDVVERANDICALGDG